MAARSRMTRGTSCGTLWPTGRRTAPRGRAVAGSRRARGPLAALGTALCLAACGAHAGRSSSTAAAAQPTTGSSTATTTTSRSSPGGPLSSLPLSVSPATGHPTSVLRFAFSPHARSGRVGQVSISFTLIVSGGHGSGCVGAHSEAVPVARPGQPVSVGVGPTELGGPWCPGTYRARVDELARPSCAPGQMCPQFIRIVAVFGPSGFRIER